MKKRYNLITEKKEIRIFEKETEKICLSRTTVQDQLKDIP